MASGSTPGRRGDSRPPRTRAALIRAGQHLIAEGRQDVPVLEITRRAGVGLGSFYNHFDTKEELFEAAFQDVLTRLADILDSLTGDLEDPAAIFAQSYRLTGRLFRAFPHLSQVLLQSRVQVIHADRTLAPRARRDIVAAARAGRFSVPDVDLAAAQASGSMIALGTLLAEQPERDDARSTDLLTEHLLRLFGVPAEEAAAICLLPLPELHILSAARD